MRLYEIYSIPTQEELDEGFKEKLAGLALSAALAFSASGAKAEQVYAYLDSAGKMQTVATQAELPADAKMKFVVDTETNSVKQLSQQPTSQRHTLYGQFKVGMSIEEIESALPDSKRIKKGPGEILHPKANRDNINLKYNGSLLDGASGNTYFEFENNKLVGMYFDIVIPKSPNFKHIEKGEGFFGFDVAELPTIFTRAYNSAKDLAGSPTSKVRSSDGGSFGLGVGGVTKGGTGLALGLDKVGDGRASVDTQNGFVTLMYMTQKGFVNTFRPTRVVIGLTDPNKAKSELEF